MQNELNRLSISLTREARRPGETVWVAALSPCVVSDSVHDGVAQSRRLRPAGVEAWRYFGDQWRGRLYNEHFDMLRSGIVGQGSCVVPTKYDLP
jgi:hypothetical protein